MKKLENVATTELVSNKQQSKIDQFVSALPFIGKKKPLIAVLRLDGVIGKIGLRSGLTLANLNDLIDKIFQMNRLEALCLSINSPGGSPVQSELIARKIRNAAEENNIPVFSFVEDMAASGGYWLACTGDEIYASKSSIIGSIGVISAGFGFHQAIKKLGIERRIYSQGKNKSILDPFIQGKESDVEIIKKVQKEVHEHFIQYVKQRRKSLNQSDEIIFNGEFWSGQTALDYGLIDGIDDLHSFIRNKYGKDIKIKHIGEKKSWIKQKLGLNKTISSEVMDDLYNKILMNRFDI